MTHENMYLYSPVGGPGRWRTKLVGLAHGLSIGSTVVGDDALRSNTNVLQKPSQELAGCSWVPSFLDEHVSSTSPSSSTGRQCHGRSRLMRTTSILSKGRFLVWRFTG